MTYDRRKACTAVVDGSIWVLTSNCIIARFTFWCIDIKIERVYHKLTSCSNIEYGLLSRLTHERSNQRFRPNNKVWMYADMVCYRFSRKEIVKKDKKSNFFPVQTHHQCALKCWNGKHDLFRSFISIKITSTETRQILLI